MWKTKTLAWYHGLFSPQFGTIQNGANIAVQVEGQQTEPDYYLYMWIFMRIDIIIYTYICIVLSPIYTANYADSGRIFCKLSSCFLASLSEGWSWTWALYPHSMTSRIERPLRGTPRGVPPSSTKLGRTLHITSPLLAVGMHSQRHTSWTSSESQIVKLHKLRPALGKPAFDSIFAVFILVFFVWTNGHPLIKIKLPGGSLWGGFLMLVVKS